VGEGYPRTMGDVGGENQLSEKINLDEETGKLGTLSEGRGDGTAEGTASRLEYRLKKTGKTTREKRTVGFRLNYRWKITLRTKNNLILRKKKELISRGH